MSDRSRLKSRLAIKHSAVLLLLWALLTLAGCTSDPGATTGAAPKNTGKPNPVQRFCAEGDTIVPTPAASCPRRNPLSKALDRVVLEYEPKALAVDLFEGIAVGARYKYRVEPSYRDEYFTRIDRYTFSRSAKPGDILGAVPLRVGFDRGSSLVFAQQFASGSDARSPLSTYTPAQIPLSAKAASRLKVGDYVRFDVRMGLTATAAQIWPLAGYLLKSEAGLSVLLDGQYQVHVFRLDEQRVRLKLVAVRGRSAKASAGLRVNPLVRSALLQYSLSELSGQPTTVKRLLPLARYADIDARVALAINKASSNLFLVDYTLDLADPEAAAAYNQLFVDQRSLADVKIANPLRNAFDLRTRLIGSIEGLDQLARRDLESTKPVITRNFQASNISQSSGVSLQVRLNTYDIQRSRTFRENFLTRKELLSAGKEQATHYLLPNWTQRRDRSMLFGMLNENQVRTADALFIADAKGRPTRFVNIGFGFEYKDRRLRPSEYRALRRKLELLLPDSAEQELLQLMQGTDWLEDRFRRDVNLSVRYFFRQGAFDELVAGGYGDEARLRRALAEFMVRGISTKEFPYFRRGTIAFLREGAPAEPSTDADGGRVQALVLDLVKRRWGSQINHVAKQLAIAFTAGNDNTARMNAILGLRRSGFYRQVGTAFWADLINESAISLDEVMYFHFELTAKGHQGIEFQYGEPGERVLYESVNLIQKILNDQGIDMREDGALESVISRMTIVGD